MAQAGLPGQILGRLIEVRFLDRTVSSPPRPSARSCR
jgi:hypothetical protein